MAASPFDSAIYRDLLRDADVAALFTDSAEVRALMLVEGALAKAQGELGVIPNDSALAIHRASTELQLDPGALAPETGANGVVVPVLVKAFRKEMQAPEHAQYLHWGATSQDIIDTALVLRLRQAIALIEAHLKSITAQLGTLAKSNADLPMAARTFGQTATVTSFGAVVASWGEPLLRHLERLQALRPGLLQVSLSGAAGTLAAMGPKGPAVRAGLAAALGLNDPGGSWHSTRDTMAEFSAWLTLVCASLGKMGEDLLLLTQSGINEVRLDATGASSTMAQKANPVLPSLLVAIARHVAALNSTMQVAVVHRQQRDGAAWMSEWLALPQIVMATAGALSDGVKLTAGIEPDAKRMLAGLDDGLNLIYAEPLSFALVPTMTRPDAQAAVKALCRQAMRTGTSLSALATARWPDAVSSAFFAPQNHLGTAPNQAHQFALSASAL